MTTSIEIQLKAIKERLRSTAYTVLKGGDESQKQAYDEIMNTIQQVMDIELELVKNNLQQISLAKNAKQTEADEAESDEVERVKNRLKLWVRRPSQINHKILKSFLELKRTGVNPITIDLLRSASQIGQGTTFDSNFNQMKLISDKSHGKVFEQDGDKVKIWKPVEQFVNEFEKNIFPEGRN